MLRRSEPVISRRSVLAGGLALGAAGLLAACSSSSDSSATTGVGSAVATDSGTGASGLAKAQLVAFFNQSGGVLRAGIPQRMVFGLGDENGALLDSGPATLDFSLHKAGSRATIGDAVTAARHDKGLQRAYYPVPVNLPDVGNYQVSTTVGGRTVEAAFRLDDAADVPIPQAGDPMPVLATPTTTDAQGVDPICTASPECPLHTTSLTTALQAGKPTALLISTPAFCQVGICGPVLDVLLSQRQGFGEQVQFIHAEVYKSGAQAAKDPSAAQLAPIVEAFKLSFEPTIILAKPDGTILERLDDIFDETELAQSLGRLVA